MSRRQKRFAVCLAILALPCFVLLGFISFRWLTLGFIPCSFDRDTWLAAPQSRSELHPDRQRMVDDLLSQNLLMGLSRLEVEKLIGPSDQEADNNYELCYLLGAERCFVVIDNECLLVSMTPDGRVCKVRLVVD